MRAAASAVLLLAGFLFVSETGSSDVQFTVSTVLRVNNPAPNDTDARAPSLAVSSSGTVHAAWSEYNYSTGAWHIEYARLLPGNTEFTKKQSLHAEVCDLSPFHPAIATWGARIYVVYAFDRSCSPFQVFLRSSDDDGVTFGDTVPIPGANESDFNRKPRVAAGLSGEVFVVWVQGVIGQAWLMASRSQDGGATFGPPITVNPTHNFSYEHDITVDTSGKLHIVWLDAVVPGQGQDLFHARAEGFMNFTPMLKIDARADYTHSMGLPKIVASQNTTNLFVTWTDDRLGGYGDLDVFLVRSEDGGVTWRSPVAVARGPGPSNQWRSSLAVDELGRAYVSWMDERDYAVRGTDLYFARSANLTDFEEWPLEAVSEASQEEPSIVYAAGRIHVVFEDWSRHRMMGSIPLPDITYLALDPPPDPLAASFSGLSPNAVTIGWSAVRDSDFSRYEVELMGPEDIDFRTVFSTVDRQENSTRLANLNENTPYTVRVLAFDEGGAWSASNEVGILTPNAPPRQPGIWLALSESDAATLAWTADDSPDFDDYVLEVSQSPDFASYVLYGRIADRGATVFTVEGLVERTTYFARLTVRDSHGAGSTSDFLFWTSPNGAPDPVAIVTRYASGSDSVILTWEASYAPDFSAYAVYASTDPTVRGVRVAVVEDRVMTTALVMGLLPETTYWLSVDVVDSGGLSGPSPAVSVRTLPAVDQRDGPAGDFVIWTGVGLAVSGAAGAALYLGRRGRHRR